MTAEPLPPEDADTVGVYEAKTQLPRLLKRVEAGETITITKHGHPIARIIPFREERRGHGTDDIVERFREFRREHGLKATDEEIREWIEEGRA